MPERDGENPGAVWAMHNEHRSEMNIELYGSEGAIDTYGENLFASRATSTMPLKAPTPPR